MSARFGSIACAAILMILTACGGSPRNIATPNPGPATPPATTSTIFDRSMHTATLLPNGDVLLAGGGWEATWWYNTETADVFDHTTASVRSTGKMSRGRDCHTATLLNDGTVLVAGGGLAYGWFSTDATEIYDPATGKFLAGPAMRLNRSNHTATRMLDGRVLITGGTDIDAGDNSSAEIYDPKTRTFVGTGSMSQRRSAHTAALLNDGRVLVAGGGMMTNGASVDIYDPASQTFAQVAQLPSSLTALSAVTLLDGSVLITGGMDPSPAGGVLADAYLFEPATNRLTTLPKLLQPRAWHTSTLLPNGKVLVAGGGHLDSAGTMTAEIYDPATRTFSQAPRLTKARSGHTATLLKDGTVLLYGGGAGVTPELYQPPM